ncbi:MAG: polysaccharide biosynthesis protein [Ferruginibacter sp.]|nr:polysaccharide biosynthesis protein [Ferruginibacter sp.]
MSSIKKLAGQTLWYGVPSIASRFLGYLMNMALPFFIVQPADTADLVQVYTIIPFLNVLFSYGMETAYFRFSQTTDKTKLFHTLSLSLLGSTILFSALLWMLQGQIVSWAGLEAHPEFVQWMIAIVATDTLATLPFAKLRQENRPKRYAFARVAGIVINVLIVIFFIGIAPGIIQKNPDSLISLVYNKDIGLGYYLLGNLTGSLFTLLLLSREWRGFRFRWSMPLWKSVMHYSYPLIIVGLGGMVNDIMSRLIYRHVVDLPAEQANHELGVFANIFRIALLVTIMIQAFRMAAEPFFFSKSKDEDAQRTYARVMKFFVIAACFMFLGTALFLDVFRWIFIHLANPAWAEGISIVPLLAMGNIFLGMYYNLSIWYKLTNKNSYGAWITIAGAIITIVLNIVLIPVWHYAGAAIATFTCYLFMMVCSYVLGQKHYPVPYALRKLIAYLVVSILLYLLHLLITYFIPNNFAVSIIAGLLLLVAFTWLITKTEAREIKALRGK